jgi:hypothetical protein
MSIRAASKKLIKAAWTFEKVWIAQTWAMQLRVLAICTAAALLRYAAVSLLGRNQKLKKFYDKTFSFFRTDNRTAGPQWLR